MDCVSNISKAKTRDVFAKTHKKSKNYVLLFQLSWIACRTFLRQKLTMCWADNDLQPFLSGANGHEFQPKAITHEFLDQMVKNQKIMSCCFNSHGLRAEHFPGKNS